MPKDEFPVGIEVTMGAYSRDLKDFILWPGRTCRGGYDVDEPFFMPDMRMSKPKRAGSEPRGMNLPSIRVNHVDRYCANRAEVEIKDADGFFQNIAGIHHIMITGNYTKGVIDVMSAENVNVIGPFDLNASVGRKME